MLDGPGDLRERDGREFCAVEMLRESFGLTVRAAYIFPSVCCITEHVIPVKNVTGCFLFLFFVVQNDVFIPGTKSLSRKKSETLPSATALKHHLRAQLAGVGLITALRLVGGKERPRVGA
jgi:hypothetical protein